MQQISIASITVNKRIRDELLELEELSESMKRFGLLNPIILTPDYTLIAGQRRLEAAKLLGWDSIAANIVTISDESALLEIEIEENTQRQQFSNEELLRAFKKLNKMKNPGLLLRIWLSIVHFFKKLFKH